MPGTGEQEGLPNSQGVNARRIINWRASEWVITCVPAFNTATCETLQEKSVTCKLARVLTVLTDLSPVDLARGEE